VDAAVSTQAPSASPDSSSSSTSCSASAVSRRRRRCQPSAPGPLGRSRLGSCGGDGLVAHPSTCAIDRSAGRRSGLQEPRESCRRGRRASRAAMHKVSCWSSLLGKRNVDEIVARLSPAELEQVIKTVACLRWDPYLRFESHARSASLSFLRVECPAAEFRGFCFIPPRRT
jgi:hypothetical protein